MSTKECFKCGEVKSLSEFYKHKMMKDGHVNKCKECNKKDVTENRKDKVEYYRAYDRGRGNRQTDGYLKKYREANPNKYKAHILVSNAVRDGKLFPEPCEECFNTHDVHAHHDDYLKPLNVRWLCAAHHRQWHIANGEAKNG